MSRRTKIVIALVALVVVGVVVAALAFGLGGPRVEVEVAEAVSQNLAVTVTASGRVDSGIRADVIPPTTGLLAEVLVTDGEHVKAGAVLARLETEPLEIQIAQARAGLRQAEAQLATVVDSGPTDGDVAAAHHATTAAWSGYKAALAGIDAAADAGPSSGDLAAAAAGANAAWKAYDLARASYDILKASVDSSPVPPPAVTAELASAELARDQAYAAYLQASEAERKLEGYSPTSATTQARAAADQAYAAFAQARSAESKIATADTSAQRDAAQAAIDQARLALSIAEDNLAKAKLVAPIDGIVLFNSLGTPVADGQIPKAVAGSAVTPSAPPFTVVDMGALRFMAEVDEVDIVGIAEGMIGRISLDAFAEPFEAEVVEVRPAATMTATGGTVFPVYLDLSTVEADVYIGMKGDAAIEVDSVPGAVTIPVEALFDEGGDTFVYKVVSSGTGEELERTRVEIGTMTDTEVQIVTGVAAGDSVALSGPSELVDRMPVSIKPGS